MKMNRVQFQPGLSMPEFYEQYGTETKCRAALECAPWRSTERQNAPSSGSVRWR